MSLLEEEHSLLAAWKDQLCGAALPPVIEVDAGLIGNKILVRDSEGQGEGATGWEQQHTTCHVNPWTKLGYTPTQHP